MDLKYVKFEDDYLSHHGVKGMKWGVRKDRERKTAIHLMNTFSKRAEKFNSNAKSLSDDWKRVDKARTDDEVRDHRKKIEKNDKYFHTHVKPAYEKVMKNSMAKSMIDARQSTGKKIKASKYVDRFSDAEWSLVSSSHYMIDAFEAHDYNPKLKKMPRINKKYFGNYDAIR